MGSSNKSAIISAGHSSKSSAKSLRKGGREGVLRAKTSEIGNRLKRTEVYRKQKRAKKIEKRERQEKRKRERDTLGDQAPPKQIPRTIENTREIDDTFVSPEDEEVLQDEAEDEFAPYFQSLKDPKLMITTRPRPTKGVFPLIGELLSMIPNAFYYKRGNFELKKICKFAHNKGFTHLLFIDEKQKKPNRYVVS
eukprot:gb/GECG01002012.1/.p1 GENE.gb/GECG01002012.1/~~gb/GECG01002012.1/.p1  ORF type:complete len:194 (+),score=27.76 gb/GECG01002012.1/:1-582(+)